MYVNLPGWTRIPIVFIVVIILITPVDWMHEPLTMVSCIFTPVSMLMPVTHVLFLVAVKVFVGACVVPMVPKRVIVPLGCCRTMR